MKEIFCINDTLANRITYFHMLAFLVALPFDMFYSEWVLVSLLVHTLIHITRQKIVSISLRSFSLALLYALTIVCTLYSTDKGQALKDWEKQLSLLLFPLVFSVAPPHFVKYKLPLLKAFAITCTLVTLYLFFDAFRVIRFNHQSLLAFFTVAFSNHNFSMPIKLHATYFSAYCLLSVTVFLYLLGKAPKTRDRIIYLVALVILFAGIFQLSSRSVVIALFVIVNIVFPIFLAGNMARVRWLAVSLSFSLMVLGVFTAIPLFRQRFSSALEQDLSSADINLNTLGESRMVRWESAWPLVKKSPLIGYGTGSEGALLKERYFDNRLYNSYLNTLNAHNEYLSMLLKAGVVGLVLYLYLLFAGYKKALREKDLFFLSFLVIVTTLSMSENILDVNKGIFFFGFFYLFFTQTTAGFKLSFAGMYMRRKSLTA